MSDQPDISALLSGASAAQPASSDTSATKDSELKVSTKPKRSRPARDNGDVLGVSWLYGSLQAAVFRRQKTVKEWTCDTAVNTVEEFALALDQGLESLDFRGTEMFLLLENELFSHQTENAPANPKAAQQYLEKRVERLGKEQGPMLWVSQQAVAVRQEQSHVLHLLPRAFYDQLNRVLLERRLDLTRILPLVVALQRELNKVPVGKDKPVLLVADVGQTTALTVGRVGGPLLFYRSILTSLSAEPARVGVEVNRSVLYAKQQFGDNVDDIWILAKSGKAASHIQAKAGANKKITVLPTSPGDWLQTASRLPVRQPINLLGGYLRRKRRRALIRFFLICSCWLALAFVLSSLLSEGQAWHREKERVAELQANEQTYVLERDRLAARNAALAKDQQLIDEILTGRLPPVPARFLNFAATVLPSGMRLSHFSTRWEQAGERPGWSFRIEGVIEGDQEVAQQVLGAFQNELARSPLKAQFNESRRTLALHLGGGRIENQETFRFTIEGGVLEN